MPLGDSLMTLTETDPGPFEPADAGYADDVTLEDLVAATPYVRRLHALATSCVQDGLRVDRALQVSRRAAPMTPHRRGVLDDEEVLVQLLGSALDADLLRLDERTTSLHLGVEGALILEHPVAAWWEAGERVLYGDPLGLREPIEGSGVLLPLLFQYIVKLPVAPLEELVTPLRDELRSEARARGVRPPSRRTVRRMLATLVALLEELGCVEWRPDGDRLGAAQLTSVGGFAWTMVITQLDGPSPAVLEMLAEHGYLEAADGMVVHRDDLPVPICDN
jgi:hypothetical protein